MTEKKVSLTTAIRKLFDEHEDLALKKLYELLGYRMVEFASELIFKHRIRASLNTLKDRGELSMILTKKANGKKLNPRSDHNSMQHLNL